MSKPRTVTLSRANGVSIEVDRDTYAASQRAAGYFYADPAARRARSTKRCLAEVRAAERDALEFAQHGLRSDEWQAIGRAERWAERHNELKGFPGPSADEHSARQNAVVDGFHIYEALRRANKAAQFAASTIAA